VNKGKLYKFGDIEAIIFYFHLFISMSKAKGAKAPVPAKGGAFDAKAWAGNGVSEEEVANIKQAFDLFDTDQGGSIDIKGIISLMQSSKLP